MRVSALILAIAPFLVSTGGQYVEFDEGKTEQQLAKMEIAKDDSTTDSEIVELIKLKLMVKYRKQIKLAMKLDKALPKGKRGHLDALFYIIDLELLQTLEELKVNDPIAPLAIPRGQGEIS